MIEDSLEKAKEYCKATLSRLEFLGLAPTPDNFELIYSYISGRLPQIKAIIDDAVQKGGLSAAQAKTLHDQYLGADREKEILQSNVKSLSQELSRVMNLVSDANDGTSQFTQTLDGFSSNISKPLSVDELHAVVSKVVEETKQIAKKNQELQAELKKSSATIHVMKDDLERVQKESVTDPLTGVGNRKFMTNELKRMTIESSEQGAPLCLLMIDIDHFKKFNDTHGHMVGDQVLKLVARTLMENLKGKDCVARYGGEEFIILLPQTRLADAQRVADGLRQSVAQKKIVRRDTNTSLGAVTVSIGVAQFHNGEKRSELVKRADIALYLAKGAGRNRVVVQEIDLNSVSKLTQGKVRDAQSFEELDSDE